MAPSYPLAHTRARREAVVGVACELRRLADPTTRYPQDEAPAVDGGRRSIFRASAFRAGAFREAADRELDQGDENP